MGERSWARLTIGGPISRRALADVTDHEVTEATTSAVHRPVVTRLSGVEVNLEVGALPPPVPEPEQALKPGDNPGRGTNHIKSLNGTISTLPPPLISRGWQGDLRISRPRSPPLFRPDGQRQRRDRALARGARGDRRQVEGSQAARSATAHWRRDDPPYRR